MTQLRDAQTSQFAAAGTTEEMILLADEMGAGEVIFDDVGEGFDRQAYRVAYQSQVTTLTDRLAVATNPAEKDAIAADLEKVAGVRRGAKSRKLDAEKNVADARAAVREKTGPRGR